MIKNICQINMHNVGPLNQNNGRASLITSILHIKYSASSSAGGFASGAFQKVIYFSRRFLPPAEWKRGWEGWSNGIRGMRGETGAAICMFAQWIVNHANDSCLTHRLLVQPSSRRARRTSVSLLNILCRPPANFCISRILLKQKQRSKRSSVSVVLLCFSPETDRLLCNHSVSVIRFINAWAGRLIADIEIIHKTPEPDQDKTSSYKKLAEGCVILAKFLIKSSQ